MAEPPVARLRLDKFLCYARITKTRSAAQALAEAGHLRLNRRVIDRAHAGVAIGDVLSFAVHGDVRILRVEALPQRRGSSAQAQAFYTDLSTATVATERADVTPSP